MLVNNVASYFQSIFLIKKILISDIYSLYTTAVLKSMRKLNAVQAFLQEICLITHENFMRNQSSNRRQMLQDLNSFKTTKL